MLHQVVREHWPAFRERAEEQGGLPAFVVRDFEEYLRCGLPEHGLCHLACHELGLGARAPPPGVRPFSPRQTSLPFAG